MAPPSAPEGTGSDRPVFFFDIDNCLYPRSLKIQDLMAEMIDGYFARHLSLPDEEARALHSRYYKDYGLAIAGLVKHHKVDPLAYNAEVDDALPLEGIIKRDEDLIQLLEGIDPDKCKLWLFTNAHITHARRVVRLLGVDHLFEGVTYCDYAQQPLLAKPHGDMFDKAERESGALSGSARGDDPAAADAAPHDRSPSTGGGSSSSGNVTGTDGVSVDVENQRATRRARCFFVDDSALNCRAAKSRGWVAVHKIEVGDADADGGEDEMAASQAGDHRVCRLQELKDLFPEFWKGKHYL